MPDYSSSAWLRGRIRKLVYVPPNKRMQLRGALGLRNIGLCTVKKPPQLMRGPLASREP